MNHLTKVLISVVCLGVAGWLLVRYFTAERPGSDEGAHMEFFSCTGEECAAEYVVRVGEDLGGRNMTECPECGGEAKYSARCPSCGKFHVLTELGRYQARCPHCDGRMPSLVEQLEDAEREVG